MTNVTNSASDGDSTAYEPPWGELYAVYQPIVRLNDMQVVAHEGLIRCADGATTPLHLLQAARVADRLGEFEMIAARHVACGFGFAAASGRLLVNVSAQALLRGQTRPNELIEVLAASGADLSRFVVEITERDIVEDVHRLAVATRYLRAAGVRIALDDFGNGHSNFEMWNELNPEFVKIDRYLVDGIAHSATRLAIVRSLVDVAAALGTDLIAEGIEQEADLVLVRDLGIRYAQGYWLGIPRRHPVTEPLAQARQLAKTLSPRPPMRKVASAGHLTAEHLCADAPSAPPGMSNDGVAALFRQHPNLHAVPVVENGVPRGIINRRHFTDRFAQPYARELYGRKACTVFMNAEPIVCDKALPIEAMSDILRGEDQRYLNDGFIVTAEGRYLGVGTGEALVRRVTELRVEAARYANPLTFLPGNIPTTEHIARLLAGRRAFVAAYFDLNHFKPFNDQYGYFRGDEMIRLLAGTLTRCVDLAIDFVGHVGGDDFVAVLQSADWQARCAAACDQFNGAALGLYEAEEVARGGIESEDRRGNVMLHPLTTVSVGIAVVRADSPLRDAEQVGSIAASAKRRAKRGALTMVIED